MTLFAALTAKGDDGGPSSTTSSSPPEAIQLHSNRVIDFLTGTTINLSNKKSKSSGGGGEDPAGAAAAKEDSTNTNTASSEGRSRYFSALSYQAIQTQQEDGGPTSSSATSGGSGSSSHLRPDLGMWDCRVGNHDAEASAMLLKRVVMSKAKNAPKKEKAEGETDAEAAEAAAAATDNRSEKGIASPPIVMAVDMSDPSEVQPVVEHMRNVILNMYDETSPSSAPASNHNPLACTTSMKALQNSPFGKTLIQEEVTVKGGTSSTEQKIALILAVIVPPGIRNASSSSSTAEEFKERQARALLLYHLHKFSLEANCTLCFVSENKGSSTDNVPGEGDAAKEENDKTTNSENDPLLGRNTAMSIDELGKIVRRVAMGLSPVEENETNNPSEGKEAKDDGVKEERPPSIHVPGSHDSELIHGAYLRNASCEGIWDAAKDDLNVALPPSASSSKAGKSENGAKASGNNNTSEGGGGDEAWLSQLASSMGLSPDAVTSPKASAASAGGEAATPTASERAERKKNVVKKRPARSTVRNKDSKPKDEKEVMNFFDNLLKK